MPPFPAPTTPAALLGGLTPEQFLADYWQKKPLLVRGALPGLENLITREQLLALAGDEDVPSRLLTHAGSWTLRDGPFTERDFKRSKGAWTVLVQGVNLALAAGDQLLRQFDFIPYARLDDLMVSFAVDGGGVGPHFDNYDVFLLQGMGQRRWRIGKQDDLSLIDDLPVRILKHFQPTEEWLLEPGDLLYLPPDWAHDGVALGDCMTLSVGFRAPPAQELADQFLTYLQDRICLTGRYSDPNLIHQEHPAEISAAMVDQVTDLLSKITWDQATVRDFLGSSLTEPKAHVVFDPPDSPLSVKRFTKAAAQHGLTLDLRSQLLFTNEKFFLNGERWNVPKEATDFLRRFANARRSDAPTAQITTSPSTMALLHEAYCDGFIHIQT